MSAPVSAMITSIVSRSTPGTGSSNAYTDSNAAVRASICSVRARDRVVEEIEMAEDPLAGDGVVRAEVAGQRLGQRRDLRAHPAFRQLGQLRAGSRSPAISASTIARPDWVRTLEATEVSLIPASWRTFSKRWISDARASI